MKLYHGTTRSAAVQIVGPPPSVDVTRGGGELGRGFYMGESLALAKMRAMGKSKSSACVIEVELDEAAYLALEIRCLKPDEVRKLWKRLQQTGTTNDFVFGDVDIVYGQLATWSEPQHKFESAVSQKCLNGARWRTF
jgi:hypothetical protein